jgi:hypothetical protein
VTVAAGKGNDDPKSDDAARAKLRRQAVDWLKADLAILVESDPPQAKAFIAKPLNHWQEDADLACIRDEKELAKQPKAERMEWNKLWAEVDSLLKRVQGEKLRA